MTIKPTHLSGEIIARLMLLCLVQAMVSTSSAQTTFLCNGAERVSSVHCLYVNPAVPTDTAAFTFASAKEALTFAQGRKHVEIYLEPAVYWLDDPDDPAVRMPAEGSTVPFGMQLRLSCCDIIGLSDNSADVVLACNRGQTQGAVGNFTMLHITGDSITLRNLTLGNYCNVDLEYPRDTTQNRPRRRDAIVQAQLAICNGAHYRASNCRFISRLNLCPLAGANDVEFRDCYFECTDDALCGTADYYNCRFTFFSSKPFYSTSRRGAHFYDCDIHSKTRGTQYLTKRTSLVTMHRCRWTSDDPNLKIEWTKRPSPDFACVMDGCTLNGLPLSVPTPTEPLPLTLPPFDIQKTPIKSAKTIDEGWIMDCHVPSDIPPEHLYHPNPDAPSWGFAQGLNGGEGHWGLVQLQRGARMMLPSDKIRAVELLLYPCKDAGQGFGSATAQYMDVCIKFDVNTLTGYGVRFRRTPDYDHAVELLLVEYRNGAITAISQAERCDLYKPGCRVKVSADAAAPGGSEVLTASIEHQGRVQTITAKMPHSNGFGGFHLQHTGSCGESATLIASIEMK